MKNMCIMTNNIVVFRASCVLIAFITQTFPSDGSLYHLGIEQYVYGKGVIFSDNSFGVGVPFYTSKSFHNYYFFFYFF